MDWNDLEPRNRKPAPKDLSVMSVAELEDYIAELEAEIARARCAIEAKQACKSAAQTFFKT